MNVGYLAQSFKNIPPQMQRLKIESYAEKEGVVIDSFVSDFDGLLKTMPQNADLTLFAANITCLGETLGQIKDNLLFLLSKKVRVISVKEKLFFDTNDETKWMLKGLELSLKIRNSMLSTLVKTSLKQKVSNGATLGRGYGSKNKKYVWTGKEGEIKSMLESGMTHQEIAQNVGISLRSFYIFLKQNPEIKNLNSRTHKIHLRSVKG